MVQLQLLSGKQAGAQFSSARFPIRIGRASNADLSFDEPGVWPQHCQIIWGEQSLILQAEPNALVCVNGKQIHELALRNGDEIVIGGLKMSFAMSPAPQSSLSLREGLTWAALAVLCVVQVAIIFSLMQ
jgi:predicted component of type VI protein secretion system